LFFVIEARSVEEAETLVRRAAGVVH
jgi:hypothetical protein